MRVGRNFSWYTYRYGDAKTRAEVRFDLDLALGATPTTHGATARLVVRDDARELEAALPELLADVDCWLVGVLRYGPVTELVLQVEDAAGFAAREPAVLARAPAGTAVERSRGWDFFLDRVCPKDADWQRIGDREAVEALLAHGAEPDAPALLEHALVGDEPVLRRVAPELAAAGFGTPLVDGRRLVTRRSTPLAAEAVSEVTVALGGLCRRLGLVYDGWRVVR